ncbi:hypothetical protein D9758_011547 [Tetrapyrgos nigripes]|uniref:Retrotransposon gag domain-containing protein n=1 Tax=Tetrapyrgos nigripes TaxID=182062 RepID=A0A8H5CN53_9AGAR|nr:hypothetical protein D9758_011547 [Tetrapyrgos nigripes]
MPKPISNSSFHPHHLNPYSHKLRCQLLELCDQYENVYCWAWGSFHLQFQELKFASLIGFFLVDNCNCLPNWDFEEVLPRQDNLVDELLYLDELASIPSSSSLKIKPSILKFSCPTSKSVPTAEECAKANKKKSKGRQKAKDQDQGVMRVICPAPSQLEAPIPKSTSALISTATLKTEKNSTTTASNSLVPIAHQSIPQVRYYSWEGEHSIILPSNPALLRSHFLHLAFSHLPFFGPVFSTSTVPSPDITHTPLPLSAPPSAIPTARPSPTLIPNPSPLPVSPAPLSPIASPITDIDMSSAALENLLQALVNNQNQLQQAITNLVNRPTHESSDKTAKLAPFKGEPAKLDSFLSLFILWAGEQKRLKLDSGKLDPQKVQADEAGAVFPWEGNWDNFTHALKVRFGVANEQQLAKNKLEALKQGDKTVAEFSQIFKMWAEKTGFSDQDLQYKF